MLDSVSKMFKKETTYHRLEVEPSEDTEKQIIIEGTPIQCSAVSYQRWLLVLLTISGVLNVSFAVYGGRAAFFDTPDHHHESSCSQVPGQQYSLQHVMPKSEWAGLTYDTPVEWSRNHPLESTDMRAANKTWQESIDIDPGVVALHKSYAAEHGLPRSSAFPWDEDKEIYYLNGYHDLHCVKSLHMAISEFVLGAPQTYTLHHITHCLNALRETVMCHAEDTPRLALVKPYPANAPFQSRMCRSWDKMTAWARPITACYQYINEEAKHLNHLERYKFCQPGSPYLEKVRAYWLEHFGRDLGM